MNERKTVALNANEVVTFVGKMFRELYMCSRVIKDAEDAKESVTSTDAMFADFLNKTEIPSLTITLDEFVRATSIVRSILDEVIPSVEQRYEIFDFALDECLFNLSAQIARYHKTRKGEMK